MASAVNNRGAVLPVVSVDLVAANGNKLVNLLLDSGAQISLIRHAQNDPHWCQIKPENFHFDILCCYGVVKESLPEI